MSNDPEKQARRKEIRRRRAAIERLLREGHANHEIAAQLHLDARTVSRNVREIERQWAKTLLFRRREIALARYELLYRESVTAFYRSQQPKVVVTREVKDGQLVKTMTRSEERPGQVSFLNMAQRAQKAIDAIHETAYAAGETQPADAPQPDDFPTQAAILAMSDDEFERLQSKVHADVEEARREEALAEAELAAAEAEIAAAETPCQGEDEEGGRRHEAAPRVPAADGLPAAAARQERTGEPHPHAGTRSASGAGPALPANPEAYASGSPCDSDGPVATGHVESKKSGDESPHSKEQSLPIRPPAAIINLSLVHHPSR